MMFKPEILRLFAGVISSWQVIVVIIALVLYLMLVFYVARLYRRPKTFSLASKQKKQKPVKTPETEINEEENDDLGLEEG
jgi:flagellar biosynthesis/type III secretory pathway M-ring protein FliF/YscJ